MENNKILGVLRRINFAGIDDAMGNLEKSNKYRKGELTLSKSINMELKRELDCVKDEPTSTPVKEKSRISISELEAKLFDAEFKVSNLECKNRLLSEKCKSLQGDIDALNEQIKDEKTKSENDKALLISEFGMFFKSKMEKLLKKIDEEDFKALYLIARGLDEDGFIELNIVKELIPGDMGATFPYEENMGYFEDLDGHEIIKWREKMGFSKVISSECFGAYEKCTYSDPSDGDEYEDYRRLIEENMILLMVENEPMYFLEGIKSVEEKII